MSYHTITVRGVEIGAGQPKICVPVVAADLEEMKTALEQLQAVPCDIVEWRADFYQNVQEQSVLQEALQLLREQLKDMPLLFTFRTAEEGGESAIGSEAYRDLNLMAADTGLVDLVDVEIFRGENLTKEIVKGLKKRKTFSIGSNHDFEKTPAVEEICRRLCEMQELDLDITKIAVMPRSHGDVITLLDAAVRMKEQYADRPCVTMSMGELGQVSRMIGGFSGSAITFGTAGKSSAPGQLPAETLREILRLASLQN